MFTDTGAKVFLFDVSHQTDNFQENSQLLQKCSVNNPNSAIITQITGRQPKIGIFAHFKPQLDLKEGLRIILTADRRISKRGTRIAVYANCQEFIRILQPGSVIRIGDDCRLNVMEVVRDSFVCTVETTGPIKPGDNVIFPFRVNEDMVTVEEEQDISLAISYKSSALLLPAAGSPEYIQSLRNHLQKIGCGHVKLFVSCSSTCIATLDKAYFKHIYDGIFYTFSNQYCANVRENIEPTDAEQSLFQQYHEMRKPIILRLNHTKDEPIALPDLVETALIYLQYYPDGFIVPANMKLRQSFADILSKDYNDNAEMMNWENIYRQLMSTSCELSVSETLGLNTAIASYHLESKAIFVISSTGRTAIRLSAYRPMCPIVVVTSNENVAVQLLMHKNCKVAVYKKKTNEKYSNTCERAHMLLCGLNYALNHKIVELDDPIVLVYRSVPILTYCDVFVTMQVRDFKTLWCTDVNHHNSK